MAFEVNQITEEELQRFVSCPAFSVNDPYWYRASLDKMYLSRITVSQLKFFDQQGEKCFQIQFVSDLDKKDFDSDDCDDENKENSQNSNENQTNQKPKATDAPVTYSL